jgi:hypothetical protein
VSWEMSTCWMVRSRQRNAHSSQPRPGRGGEPHCRAVVGAVPGRVDDHRGFLHGGRLGPPLRRWWGFGTIHRVGEGPLPTFRVLERTVELGMDLPNRPRVEWVTHMRLATLVTAMCQRRPMHHDRLAPRTFTVIATPLQFGIELITLRMTSCAYFSRNSCRTTSARSSTSGPAGIVLSDTAAYPAVCLGRRRRRPVKNRFSASRYARASAVFGASAYPPEKFPPKLPYPTVRAVAPHGDRRSFHEAFHAHPSGVTLTEALETTAAR